MPIADDPAPRPDDPFEGVVLDEDFVRSAAVKEQSGRARMLAAKWKQQPPQPEPWRASADPAPAPARRRFGRRPKPVDPWGRRRRRNWQTPLFVVLAAAVTLAALNVDRLNGWYHRGQESSALPATGPATAPAPAPATTAPPTAEPGTPTVEHPWAGSPADAWKAGADALVLPEAKGQGVFDKEEVADMLDSVRQYLVLTNLDPKTLHGETPAAALAMMDRTSRADLEKALAHPTADADATTWLSRFDPRRAVPVTDVVKARGTMTFEGDGDRGLLVHTDYIFVYALRPGPDAGVPRPGQSTGGGGNGGGTAKPVALTADAAPRVEREIVRRQQDFRFYDPARYKVQRGKLFLDKWYAYLGNNVCTTGSGYLETDFSVDFGLGTDEPRTGKTVDPYDPNQKLDDREGCDTLSRS
ncbi:hypothetical protein [Streptomyces sp. NRRL B-24484]|uniref:SCO2583/SCO2584 N-terminal domain-containing protein n=1 Tax=Streptomyces sp. NRRL B-24484 TaxID=1463833 RepID=UPI000AC3A4A0|nr:hypothetical protein [Streptomyces sp. NRRL B-24484]